MKISIGINLTIMKIVILSQFLTVKYVEFELVGRKNASIAHFLVDLRNYRKFLGVAFLKKIKLDRIGFCSFFVLN